jgi:hypothetical protein
MEGCERFEGSATERRVLRGCGSVRRARALVLSAAAAAGLCLLAFSGRLGLQVRRAGGSVSLVHAVIREFRRALAVRACAPVLACARSCMCVILCACWSGV